MIRSLFPYLEIIFYYLIIDSIYFLFFLDDLNIGYDFYWIPIVLISIRYGLALGITSAVLAVMHLVFFAFHGIPTKLAFEIYLESYEYLYPIAFLAGAFVIGSIRQKQLDRENSLQKKLTEKEEEIELIEKDNMIMRGEVRELEKRAVGSFSSMQTLYNMAKKLEALDEIKIFSGCLEIIRDHFSVEKSSLYMRESGYFVLKASSGWEGGLAAEGKIIESNSIMNLVVKEKKILTIKELLLLPDFNQFLSETEKLLALVPIITRNGDVIGVVNIEKIDFFAYNTHNLNLIALVCEWTSYSLENKKLYEKLASALIKDETTNLYTVNFFYHQYDYAYKKAHQLKESFILTILKINSFGFFEDERQQLLHQTVSALLLDVFSEIDQVFMFEFSGTYAVLSPKQTIQDVEKTLLSLANTFYDIVKQAINDVKVPELIFKSLVCDASTVDKDGLLREGEKACQLISG